MFNFIKKWHLALRWWLFFILINIGTVFCVTSGLVNVIYQVDFTKITFIVYAIFYGMSVQHGIRVMKVCKKEQLMDSDIENICHANEPGWFLSEIFTTLGLIGTFIGIIVMLMASFADIDPSNTLLLKHTLADISRGMGAALYTSVVGLICGMLLKIQLFDFQHSLERCKSMFCELR